MANESNDRQFNPYAPPLCSLTPNAYDLLPSEAPRLDLDLIKLLDVLAKEPMQVHGHVDAFHCDGTVRTKPRSAYLAIEFIGVMSVLCVVAIFYSFNPARQLLAIFIWGMVLIGFVSARRFKKTLPPKHRQLAMTVPAGDYSWLIGEGGILVSTPGNAQWAVPWSLFDRIYCDTKWWHCQFRNSHDPQWRMPITAFEPADAARFQSLVDSIHSLAHTHRPHPVAYAARIDWTDQMTMDAGHGWSLLREGSVAWCDLRGLVCSLPNAETSRNADTLSIRDQETGWTADLPLVPTSR